MRRNLEPIDKLHKKLFEVRREAMAVAKTGEGEGFDFARFEDVMAEASRLLDEKKILIVPGVADEAIRVLGPRAIAKVAMEFEVIDISSGGSFTKRWSGSADDEPGGKALFKSQTGCEKYFLAKLLRIPFGTDPEESTSSSSTELVIPPEERDPDADRVRAKQDAEAEAPQTPPARHEKPLPKSDLPPAVWEEPHEASRETVEEHAAHV